MSSRDQPRGFGSFGRPEQEPVTRDADVAQPTPVLHVGEVHADLVLHITAETINELGSQIASMIASATKAGFEHGLNAAMGDPDGEPAEPQ